MSSIAILPPGARSRFKAREDTVRLADMREQVARVDEGKRAAVKTRRVGGHKLDVVRPRLLGVRARQIEHVGIEVDA